MAIIDASYERSGVEDAQVLGHEHLTDEELLQFMSGMQEWPGIGSVSDPLNQAIEGVFAAGSDILDDKKKLAAAATSAIVLGTMLNMPTAGASVETAAATARPTPSAHITSKNPRSTLNHSNDVSSKVRQLPYHTTSEKKISQLPNTHIETPSTGVLLNGDSPWTLWQRTAAGKMPWGTYRKLFDAHNNINKMHPGDKYIDPLGHTHVSTLVVPTKVNQIAEKVHVKYPVKSGDSVDAIGEALAKATGKPVAAEDQQVLNANGGHFMLHPKDLIDLGDFTATEAFSFMSLMNARHAIPQLQSVETTRPQSHILNIDLISGDSSWRIAAAASRATGIPVVKMLNLLEGINHIHNHAVYPKERLHLPLPSESAELLTAAHLQEARGGSTVPAPLPRHEIVAPTAPVHSTAEVHPVAPDALSQKVGFTINTKDPLPNRVIQNLVSHTITPAEKELTLAGEMTRLTSVRSVTGFPAEVYRQIAISHGASPEVVALADRMPTIEKESGLNGIFLWEHMGFESSWGNSDIARSTNNISGDNAFDNCPKTCATKFPNVEASMNHYVGHVKNDYVETKGIYNSGGDLIGHIFVRYSTAGQIEAIDITEIARKDMKKLGLKLPVPVQPPTAVSAAPQKSLSPALTPEQSAAFKHEAERQQRINTMVDTAIAFKGSKDKPTAAYASYIQHLRDQHIPTPYDGKDCALNGDGIVRSAMDFPASGTWETEAYARSHPELFDVIAFNNESQLQRGDLIFVNKAGGYGGNGHEEFVTGELPDGTNGTAASGGESFPHGVRISPHDPLGRGQKYIVRLK